MGSSELIPCFALLACVASALPIKLSLSQPPSFFTFAPPTPRGISKLVLSCQLRLSHDNGTHQLNQENQLISYFVFVIKSGIWVNTV